MEHLVESYALGTSKNLVSGREDIKYNNIVNNRKMINFDEVTKENIKQHNSNWLQIPHHPCR